MIVIWLPATCTPLSVADTTHGDGSVANVTVLQVTVTTGVAGGGGAVTVTCVEAVPDSEPFVATTLAGKNPAAKYVQLCDVIAAGVWTVADPSPQSYV